MGTIIYSWMGIEDEKLKTGFSVIKDNVIKGYVKNVIPYRGMTSSIIQG